MPCFKKIDGADPEGSVGEGAGEEANIELILAAGLQRGLRMEDTERMTLGMWTDYVIECHNIEARIRKKEKSGRRRATQEDFDRF